MNSYDLRSGTDKMFSDYFRLYVQDTFETYGSVNTTPEQLRVEWDTPGFDPETHFMGVFQGDSMIGYGIVTAPRQPPVRPYLFGYVDPNHRDRGLGTQIVTWGLTAAESCVPLCPPEARVVLQGVTYHSAGESLLSQAGFVRTRESLQLHRDLADIPPILPSLPRGYTLRTLADTATLVDLVEVYDRSFRDHRGYITQDPERVMQQYQKEFDSAPNFDPQLVGVLDVEGEPAAFFIVLPESEDDQEIGWIDGLGVDPRFRRRGIASFLLDYGFAALAAKGKKGVDLVVDGSSLTGADKLYYKKGMNLRLSYTIMNYRVRDGVEITPQG